MSFFEALDPGSKFANGKYKDKLVSDKFLDILKKELSFKDTLAQTFELVMGQHYINASSYGQKGLLDYLILPLLARELFNNTVLDKDQSPTIKALAMALIIPIEIARFSCALAITLLLVPVVAILNLCKNIRLSDQFFKKNNVPIIMDKLDLQYDDLSY